MRKGSHWGARAVWFGIASVPLVVIAVQGTTQSLLTRHIETLQGAQSLTARVSVQPVGGAADVYTIKLSKPNLLRIEGPNGFVVSDGQKLFTYTKADNSYTEEPASGFLKAMRTGEAYPWLAFFDKDFASTIRTVRAGQKRTVRGAAVTEVVATLQSPLEGTPTLYIDDKLGVARGFSGAFGKGEWLVVASEIELSDRPIDPATFAFQAPAGAKLVAPAKPAEPTYAAVQSLFARTCMPCHNRQNERGGYEFTTYEGIVAGVDTENPRGSRIVRSITATGPNRMPKDRAPLRAEEIDLVIAWIAAGAKR